MTLYEETRKLIRKLRRLIGEPAQTNWYIDTTKGFDPGNLPDSIEFLHIIKRKIREANSK